MRKVALGVAAIALMAAPGVAQADTNAVVGIDYNQVDFSGAGHADVYGLNGAFNHGFAGDWNFQLDGYDGRASNHGCCISTNYAAAHIGVRNESYSAAAFVGLQDFEGISGAQGGVEGQMFFSQAMLEASVSYADWNDFDLNATNAQIDGAWFVTPDFSLTGAVGYTRAHENTSANFTSYGLGGEYRFDNSPASVNLGWRRTEGEGEHFDTWSVGLTFDLGTGSLQDRTRSGPSWNGARSLYDNFDRAFGSAPLVSDRRLKRDITLLATLANGAKVYSFRYNWSNTIYVGVMAQDLLANHDWRRALVRQANGYFAVDYAVLGLRMATLEEWKKYGIAAVLNERNALRVAA